METILVLLILMGVILFGAPLLAHSYFSSQEAIAVCFQEMESRAAERAKTEISLLREQGQDAANIEIVLENRGVVKLADYDRWDVIVEYDDGVKPQERHSVWLPYSPWPEDNHWWVVGIYADATIRGSEVAEAYEPGILNPEEEMVLALRLSPAVGITTTNVATIVTVNGISASKVFTR